MKNVDYDDGTKCVSCNAHEMRVYRVGKEPWYCGICFMEEYRGRIVVK